MSSDPSSWKEASHHLPPGPAWAFKHGYHVQSISRHENEEEFRAFTFYLESGSHRSIEDTAQFIVRAPGTVRNWSKKYNWAGRIAAYDKREITLAFAESNKIQRREQRRQIDAFRQANEDQARLMMGVSTDLMNVIAKRINKAEEEGEDIPLSLVSGLMRAASNMSDTGRQAWATSLGVNELMSVVEQEVEEAQVEIMDVDVDEAYQIPLDEDED